MLFGESKCAFLDNDKEKIVESHEAIVMNGVTIQPFKENSHKYHGQDENIGYVRPLDKARVLCRVYKSQVEDMFQVMISSNSEMSSRYCLNLTNDALPRYVYEQHGIKLVPGSKAEYPSVEFIHSQSNIEYWWKLPIKTKNNKPDIIIWNSEVKICSRILLFRRFQCSQESS